MRGAAAAAADFPPAAGTPLGRGSPGRSGDPPGPSPTRAQAPAQRRLRLEGSAPPLTLRHAQGGGCRPPAEARGGGRPAPPLGPPAPPAPVPASWREEAALFCPPRPGPGPGPGPDSTQAACVCVCVYMCRGGGGVC
ncbi:unnamed protein product, partial [Bubo scandiacus]